MATNTPFMIIRLWPEHHQHPAVLRSLLRVLARHRNACDEVWFCTQPGTPELAVHRAAALQMGEVTRLLREMGIQPGLQIAQTLGHMDCLFEVAGGEWQRMVGHDGTVARACHCPRAPGFLDYLRAITTMYAAWQPSSVWIDDDLRMHFHAPVSWGCFCERCLAAFSDATGRQWEREMLLKAFRHSPDGKIRQDWVAFNQQSLAGVAAVVAQAVRETAPACRLGLQHCGHAWGLYSGADWEPVFNVLAADSSLPVGSRPGGGYYQDHRPRELLAKALDVARQVNRLPAGVTDICPEVENFTHVALGKSAHGTAIESAWYLAQAGCTSLSYAILCSGHESMSWYGTLLKRLAAWRPFFERFVVDHHDTVGGGLDPVFSRAHMTRPLRKGEDVMAWAHADLASMHRLVELGLPLAPDSVGACASLLSAEAIAGLTDAQIPHLLASGLLLDGAAAHALQERGWAEAMGLTVEPLGAEEFLFERFTDDPLNAGHGGHLWRQYAFGERMSLYRCFPCVPDARILGQYQHITTDDFAGAATIAVNTSRHGRLVVFGNNGWETVVSSARRAQMLAAADWVSHGRLPVIVDTPAQVAVAVRLRRDGRPRGIMLLNLSIDNSPPLSLRVRGTIGETAVWIRPERCDRQLTGVRHGVEMRLQVPPLAPWSLGYLRFDE